MPESYAHRFAKQLVITWLRDQVREVEFEPYSLLALHPIKALVPTSSLQKGIYEEYPICGCETQTTLHHPWPNEQIPSYQLLVSQGILPLYILDIAISHLGQIKYGIEIVHRHEVPATKITGLQQLSLDLGFQLFRLEADWILSQCQPPSQLKMQKLIPGPLPRLPFTEKISVSKCP